MQNTPHINQTNEIAETILLPGDPLRAKFIAENFLENPVQFNAIRGALGFTGTYNGKKISVMGTGMGMPSIGIYSYELINTFGVKNLIRIGSCGALSKDLSVYDIVFGMAASTDSNFASQYQLPGTYAPCCSYTLLEKAKNIADSKNIPVHIGNILSTDVFYSDFKDVHNLWAKMGVLATEMEAAALYMNAARLGANALCILTVSDHIMTGEEISAEKREKSFTKMMEIALSMA
ncbi:purine-nucleoside phosphorylase [[Clostridium] colinum]|uniref:purine-nucleoside phosphorylase n=1 Tax=[Clostridium] colinum TaxID=36835 RepID=UPI002024EDB9|nr:purine-nucleoside phosphorylase [[Clostridium] colinum]